MRLLMFSITFRPFIGGAELAEEEILKRLPEIQTTVITALLDKKLSREETLGNIIIKRVGWGRRRLDKYLFPFLAFRLASQLHRENPFNLSQAIMANYAGLAALIFKFRFPSVPYLLTMQSGDSPFFFFIRTWWFYPIYRMVYRKADFIQPISNYLSYRAKSYGYKGPIKIVPNGVDLALFQNEIPNEKIISLKRELGIKEDETVIVTASRLVYKNAIDQLILGFHEWQSKTGRNATLLIIGDGNLRKKLEKLAEAIGAKRVIFLGEKQYRDLPQYFKLADVFIRPSRSEGMGNAFIEAMAAGIPVIATPVGGIPDFLEHKVTGFFCEKDNPMSIARAINEILGDNELRRMIVKNAKALVEERYDWEKISGEMNEVYHLKLNP